MKPRVLHLAYEDPRAPGAGGGSVRTREIDERLAGHFDIDVVSVPYPGAVPYRSAGVSYGFLGARRGGTFVRQLSYFAALPGFVRRHGADYDLVVEDFGAPFSSIGVPRFTSTPVVGVVQWLFAQEKARQYHLPFQRVERFGVRSHRRLVAVSSDIGARAAALHPDLEIDVVCNGVPEEVLTRPVSDAPRADLLYLGRLDPEHKGLDLLLEAFGAISGRVDQDLHIGGDGPGERWLRDEIARRGLTSRVRLLGRVPAEQRFDVLERYDAVLMPSRYESFGMIAAEAAAVGTPVVAFDIACLRDLVPDALLAPAFDTDAYAALVLDLCRDPAARRAWAAPLRASVAHLSWAALAERQRRVYDDVIIPSVPLPEVPTVAAVPTLVPPPVAADAALPQLLRATFDGLRTAPPATVLFGNYGNGNMGDEAILRGVLAAVGDHARVTVVTRDPDRVRSLHPGAAAVSMLSLAGIRRVFTADVVAIGGGGIFGNNMNLLPRVLPLVALVLQVLGKDVVFVAIGAYRTTPRILQAALRRLARHALLVTARDEESAEVLGGDVHVVADPGGAIVAAAPAEVDRALAVTGLGTGPLLGVSLKPTVDAEHDERQLAIAETAVRAWRRQHPTGGVLLLCLSDVGNFGLGHDVSDRTLAARLQERLGDEVTTATFGPDVTPWLMKGVIGRCDAVVAHRLHAQMFAHDEGVPLFGLTWERKADVFLEGIGAPRVDLVTGVGDDVAAWVGTLQVDRETA